MTLAKIRSKKAFHADTNFFADVTSQKHRLSLVVADCPDGCLCVAVYPDSGESIMLAEFQKSHDAKRYLEEWARLVHRVSSPIEWFADVPSKNA